MSSLNRAMIIGNLTRDPELKTTSTGQSVVSFSVATNRSWTGQDGQKQEKVEFHNVVAWGKLAEIINQYMKKGRKIYIDGRLQTRDWQGQDGIKRYRTEIVAENMVMLGGGAGQSNGSYQPAPATPANTPNQQESVPIIEQEAPTINETNSEEVPF